MVVAIIAILAGILLPALNSARNKAISINCSSRIKQIGTADAQYQADFEYFCPISSGMSSSAENKPAFCGEYKKAKYADYTKDGFLTPYLKKATSPTLLQEVKTNVFFCPDPWYMEIWQNSDYHTIQEGSWGGIAANAGIHGRPPYLSGSTPKESSLIRPGRVVNPSSKVSFGDGFGPGKTTDPVNATLANNIVMSLINVNVHFRHAAKKANILMSDGHAESKSAAAYLKEEWLIGKLDASNNDRYFKATYSD